VQAELKPVKRVGRLLLTSVETSLLKKKLYKVTNSGGAKCSAPVQTGPGAQTASYTIGIGFFPGVKWPGRDVNHLTCLALRLKKE